MDWASAVYIVPTLIALIVSLHWGLYKYAKTTWHPDLHQGRRRVLVLTAHPDDECMFFSPAIIHLSRRHDVFLLCLSNGNAEGLGKIRGKELLASGKQLGINPNRIQLKDDPRLPDSMTAAWNSSVIIPIVQDTIKRDLIDMIITFDEYGISGHTNHRALHDAMKEAKKTRQISIPVYKLVSISVARKFASVLDLIWTAVSHKSNSQKKRMLFVSSFNSYIRGRAAMFRHVSQLVWFRYLYLIFSRYMFLNDLEEVTDS